MANTHFVLTLKIERVESRDNSVRRTSGTSVERVKTVAEMTSVVLKASSYEGILLKAEKLVQLERDLGEDAKIKGAVEDDDDREDEF